MRSRVTRSVAKWSQRRKYTLVSAPVDFYLTVSAFAIALLLLDYFLVFQDRDLIKCQWFTQGFTHIFIARNRWINLRSFLAKRSTQLCIERLMMLIGSSLVGNAFHKSRTRDATSHISNRKWLRAIRVCARSQTIVDSRMHYCTRWRALKCLPLKCHSSCRIAN